MYSIFPSGDHAITISFGNQIDLKHNSQVHQLFASLRQQQQTFWMDIIPAYTSLTIVYDVGAIRKQYPSAYEWVRGELEKALENIKEDGIVSVRTIKVPVCYDLSFAPDSKGLAANKKISIDELIELHSQVTYHVYMIGFLPGFAYMGTVDDRIASPRHIQPRTHVPAGSVGIAGNQTGIYPLDSPGGWKIIGRTPVNLFDVRAADPVLLQAGDEINFFPITKVEFETFDQTKFNLSE